MAILTPFTMQPIGPPQGFSAPARTHRTLRVLLRPRGGLWSSVPSAQNFTSRIRWPLALPEARPQKLRSGSWLQAVPTATKLPIHHHHDRVLPSKPPPQDNPSSNSVQSPDPRKLGSGRTRQQLLPGDKVSSPNKGLSTGTGVLVDRRDWEEKEGEPVYVCWSISDLTLNACGLPI